MRIFAPVAQEYSPMEGSVRFRRREASQYLRDQHCVSIAPATLAKLACLGGGPRFRKFNRIPLYDAVDLDAWVDERLTAPRRSTSEASSSGGSVNAR
jgi:hypothetical protein